ncbi:unnamed protein product [Linum tenue]|uniref:Uncharacterized protein n=1 Tax=Linum tenue TaxID=586396 RepID=A0AAV0NU03_9ROSI|nr:unnamed protein product [Linum tenue]
MYGSSLWDGEEQRGSDVDGIDEAGAGYEVDSSSCNGWSARYLRHGFAVIISTRINPKAKSYYLFDGYAHLSSGLACGLVGHSTGMAIGIIGDVGVRYYL